MQEVVKTAQKYADNRIFQVSKGNHRMKINMRELKDEIVNASVFGELSALERLMAEIVDDKELTKNDIEAKLHLTVVDLYNVIRGKMGFSSKVSLEDYLALRGYYGSTAGSQVVEH